MIFMRRVFLLICLIFNGLIVSWAQNDSLSGANALIHHNEQLRSRIETELNLRNRAILSNDLKTIYFYFHPYAIGPQVFEEFESEHKNYMQDLDSLNLQLQGFELLAMEKIFYCNQEYQCLLKLRTTFLKKASAGQVVTDRYLIAISGNGENWKFIQSEEKDLQRLKNLFPFLCLEME